MKSIIFLTLLVCLLAAESYGISENPLNAVSLYNGYWTNRAQLGNGGQDHDLIQTWVIPVDVPAFRPNPVTFIKETNNGTIRLLNLCVMSDGVEKDSVIIQIYNFTESAKYKTYNLESLKTITREDLEGTEDCFAVFDFLNKGVMNGNYPDCSYTINGKHPRFTVTVTCDISIWTPPLGTAQTSPVEPYISRRIGPKYLLVNRPKDYVGPCDK